MYSYVSNNLPKYLNNYFTLNQKTCIVMILVRHEIYLLITKGQIMANFHLNIGAQIWNNLPIELKSLQS